MAPNNAKSLTSLDHYRKRVEAMSSERTTFMGYWRELSEYHLANRGRFLVTDRNKGNKRNDKQINNTSRLSGRTLAAGMMAGITSPARPWFRLALSDTKLMEFGPVKTYLMQVEELLREIFNKSNTYNVLHQCYEELGVFGTGAFGIFEDFDNVIRCKHYTIGSYMLALNGQDKVDTFAREYQMTVAQMVDQFGIDNVSHDVKKLWDNGSTEVWTDVTHVVELNSDADGMSPFANKMKFRSVYFEGKSLGKGKNTKTGVTTFLRESGFKTFPIVTPRWSVVGEDIYGTACPGMDALGDTKGLQIAERAKYEGVEKMVRPALIAPVALKNKIRNIKPNDIVFDDETAPNTGIRPIYQVNLPLQYVLSDIEKLEQRIGKTFFEDLFLMLANSGRSQITAREVAERHEEKLLMLGPVLERLHTELLDLLIERTFNIASDAGILPPTPTELKGKDIKIEYISILAQAQRMVSSSGVEQVAGFIGQLAAIWPEARHKFDPAKAIDDYANAVGIAPDLIRSKDEYEKLAATEAQQMQQQQQQQDAVAAANVAGELAKAPAADPSNMAGSMGEMTGV